MLQPPGTPPFFSSLPNHPKKDASVPSLPWELRIPSPKNWIQPNPNPKASPSCAACRAACRKKKKKKDELVPSHPRLPQISFFSQSASKSNEIVDNTHGSQEGRLPRMPRRLCSQDPWMRCALHAGTSPLSKKPGGISNPGNPSRTLPGENAKKNGTLKFGINKVVRDRTPLDCERLEKPIEPMD